MPPKTVKLPGVGKVNTTMAMAAVGGVVVLGYVYYRRKKTAAANAASTASVPASQIDAATGYPYGSSQDALALASQSAYQNPVSYGGGGGPAGNPNNVNNPQIGTGFTNNAQWEQAAIAYLTAGGAPFSAVSSALGKFISGVAVTDGSADADYIHQAIAAEGQPPIPGPNGYPPSIRTGGGPSPAPSGGGGGGTPPAGPGVLATPYIRLVNIVPKQATLQWDPIPGATGYHLYRNGSPITNVTGTSYTVNRSPGATYVMVALGNNNAHSANSNSVHVVP